ncbi:DUF937 domain-containing protein [Ramlibacter alkalitolerans]|uniref:DUF937 domain-containing protein n=1 Tax=Ramlibacter alkalitolerans TaxID=2039631 RepID=A0ABS1JS29_9BURK|nr:DUF937 domain-containing protein [Ramlibacter alkalitolerans]MBL0427070.1 DUF937 domain-containing protein [Ramlibacter alkalitolerans]
MQITDMLAQAGGLQSIARELEIEPHEARSGAEALLPAILGGLRKQAQGGGGGGLGDLLGQLGGGELMDQVLAPQKTDVAPGDAVLGQIFGSRDVSRTVAQSASAQSGLSPELLKKMLPLLAMLVTGFMSKQGAAAAAPGQGGGLGGMLGGVLGGMLGGGQPGQQGGALGGLGALLDANGDGNALDDILRLAGKARG